MKLRLVAVGKRGKVSLSWGLLSPNLTVLFSLWLLLPRGQSSACSTSAAGQPQGLGGA